MSLFEYPLYVAGRPVVTGNWIDVINKYSGIVAGRVALAGPEEMEKAIQSAVASRELMQQRPAHARQKVLWHLVKRCEERAEELAQYLCVEAGKPIRDSRGEVGRLIETFKIAAEECVRIRGEIVPLDRSQRTQDYTAHVRRVPIGVCSLITPFNFPLNLVAHKMAPALAVGCPFIVRPASSTPVGALILGQILAETDLPPESYSILPCQHSTAAPLVEDERIAFLSFTGSPAVGWELRRRAGRKRVTLELGGNAACVVEPDTDIDDAVTRVVFGAFYQSGQSCISVQRLYVHQSIYETFRDRLVAKTAALVTGDPADENTFIGPVISEVEARRMEEWISEATGRGARVLCGGKRRGTMIEATLLENVPKNCRVSCGEVFGPVAVIEPYNDFKTVLKQVNDSTYGLQAGIFTRDIHKAELAWETLEVGGVVIGDVPSWRSDEMPYGGVKNSGFGREGVRYAMEEMLEMRSMIIRKRKLQ